MIAAINGLSERAQQALWEGDVEWLSEEMPCGCCCAEHTHGDGCPAYAWGGCRGQSSMSRHEHAAWQRFYAETRGMTESEFYGAPAPSDPVDLGGEEELDSDGRGSYASNL